MKVRINPVLLRELRVKMRGWRSVITIIAYLAVIILVTSFVMLNMTGSPYSVTIDPNRSIGTYTYLSTIQFILVKFIAPALTSGSISGERERQTKNENRREGEHSRTCIIILGLKTRASAVVEIVTSI
jgi:ABC-type transport system involved in multi-copper enzyme maturation permease subunit